MIDNLLWSLITLQIAMGAFDTLYHHELTERLAWRPSQARELRLHAVRNLFYAVIFLTFGWSEPHGVLAWILIALLGIEICITLWDFVEEDMTRALPGSERINHTLLALNYGAILVLAAPVLLTWAGLPTGLVAANHGVWSWLCLIAAVGVALFALRDWMAATRAPNLVARDAATLAADIRGRKRILVTGGTGFVGRRLVAALVGAGHEVTVLTRNPQKALGLAVPLKIVTDLTDLADDTKLDAIINLSGEPVADGLWTAAKRRRIIASRVDGLRDIEALVARLTDRPEVLVSASAIGWYGVRDATPLDEEDAPTACFTHEACRLAEAAAEALEDQGLRVVTLRIGLVLGIEGGLLARLLTPFEFGLGGPIGDGRQIMSWIALDDLVRLIVHAIEAFDLSGPVNATAPQPVSNAEFSRALGKALGRPSFLRVPAWPLRLTLGDFGREILLGGQNVVPEKAFASAFVFEFPTIGQALTATLGSAVPKSGTQPKPGDRSDLTTEHRPA